MPRPGGESGKLGVRYEAVWTVDSILDVLSGEAASLTVEPFSQDESLGIEFTKEMPDGVEFHSAKRQTSAPLWSLAELLYAGPNGRSVLGDLVQKLRLSEHNKVVFVSGTTAQELEELCSTASLSDNATAFMQRIDSLAINRRQNFEQRLLQSVFNDNLELAWSMLRRIRVVGWTEAEMIRRVDQQIRGALYRIDGGELDPTAARCLLAEMVLSRFGQQIRREEILSYLQEHHLAERDWARDRRVHELIGKRNLGYTAHVEAELIAGERIPRDEADKASGELIHGDKKRVVFIGAAGFGKSCTVAQTLTRLGQEDIPVLAIRLDIQTEVLSSCRLGEELGFPESPVLVLAGMAGGRRCVLLLDQLDAISFTSGRNQNLWDVFEEMLREAQNYPQMRLLFACRAFDAEHDPRLRRLLANTENSLRMELGRLPLETVRTVLQNKAGINPIGLDSAHLELLRTPLHLSLYLLGDPQTQPRFGGVQDLFTRYWNHKQKQVDLRLGRASQWYPFLRHLVDYLNRSQKLSAPLAVLDRFGNADIQAMASENVIVLDGNSVRFFHEAFFDYCCARIFAGENKSILELLTEGGSDQHLFRRAQVRQILEYQRGNTPSSYLRDLRDLLTDTRVRFHLRKLTTDWLGSVVDPREAEWSLLASLEPGKLAGTLAARVLWGRSTWALLLYRLGVWERWLASVDEEIFRVATRMLSMPDVMKDCSVQVAALFRPYVDGQKTWRSEFGELFQFAEHHHSREIFTLFRDAMLRGLVPFPMRNDWSTLDRLSEVKPEYAVELIAASLDQKSDPTLQTEDHDGAGRIDDDFISNSARRAPEAFTREFLPRIIKGIRQAEADGANAWGTRNFLQGQNFNEYDEALALEQGLVTAMRALSRENPAIFDALTEEADGTGHEFIEATLLLAWSENGPRYAEKIVSCLLHDSRRLELGCPSWGLDSGASPAARTAVRNAAPHCSQDSYERLETAILTLVTQYEREKPRLYGYTRMRLLACLPSDRISRKARLHFNELKRKFPWEKFDDSEREMRGGFIGSPIPDSAVELMTDAQWLKAMHRYARKRDTGADFLKGGKIQLSRVLRRQAQTDKSRFAQLALRMQEEIEPEYFNEILSGITTTTLEAGASGKLPPSAMVPLDVDIIAKVILRMYAIGSHECGKDICWAARRIADQSPPEEIFPIICHYAVNDPDPKSEQWQEKTGGHAMWGGDPHFQGMNCVRGAAAGALEALLFADRRYFAKIEHAVLAVVHDRSIAVRSSAMGCLVAMLNFDRPRAVRLYLALCEGTEILLATHHSEKFIYHATYDQYDALRPLLLNMLKAEHERPRAIASRQITRSTFHGGIAVEDIKEVLRGDVTCRKAAGEIYSHNLRHGASRSVSAEKLSELFNDPDSAVRTAASYCFVRIPPEQLVQEQDLMRSFIKSKACLENAGDLFRAFEECLDPLPEVVCQLAEKLIAEHRSTQPLQPTYTRSWAYHLPSLIARLYDQAQDESLKSRCLDIIDDMLELGFGEVEKELVQVER